MKVPKRALLFKNSDEGAVELLADGDDKNRFRLIGNSGKPFDSGFFGKMIIDFEGLRLRKSPLPVLREHDVMLIAGTAKRTETEDGLVFEGKFSETTDTGRDIKDLLGEGIKFESSIRVEPKAVDFIDKGSSEEINGQTVKGPIRVLRNNLVSEVSFVLFGQDPNTSGKMIASENEEFIELTENHKEFIMGDSVQPQITEQQLKDATAAAAKDEQSRIMAINAELPGDALAEVRKQAIAEGKTVDEAKSMAFSVTQKADVAEMVKLKAENATQAERLAAIKAGGGDEFLGQEDNGEVNINNDAGENKFQAALNRYMDDGMNAIDAVKLAQQRYPDEHKQYVAACPASKKPLKL